MKHSYTNNSSKVLNSLSSFRLKGEISHLRDRFLTPGVVRNDDTFSTSFRERNEREISSLRNGFLSPVVVRNDGSELMKNKFNQKLFMVLTKSKPYLLLILCLCITSIAAAQPPDTGGDVDVPIDGGLSVLLAAGVGYSIRELRKRKAG
jgi:hypothetical protein